MLSGRFEAVKVQGDDLFWVGAIDWDIRSFHGYSTHSGTTYNAYLLLGEKTTLIDTVKAPFHDEMMSRIASVTDPSSIEVIVSNHSEMDHSGCLPEVMDQVRPSALLTSKMGARALAAHFPGMDRDVMSVVSDGEETELSGNRALFMETRMLHWPDSMFTMLPDRKLLFSQDAFGMHLASAGRFDNENDEARMSREAATYYANILMPYSSLVEKLLEKVEESGLSLDTIAPDHGPIWRSDPSWILNRYARWSSGCSGSRIVVAYDTMWGSTRTMAHVVGEGASSVDGIDVRLIDLEGADRSDVATELLESSVLLVGSSTLNNDMLPKMADLMTYLRGLKPRGLAGDAFGSYGWSGEAVPNLRHYLGDMSVQLLGDGIRSQYVPDGVSLDRCRELGRSAARHLSGGGASRED